MLGRHADSERKQQAAVYVHAMPDVISGRAIIGVEVVGIRRRAIHVGIDCPYA